MRRVACIGFAAGALLALTGPAQAKLLYEFTGTAGPGQFQFNQWVTFPHAGWDQIDIKVDPAADVTFDGVTLFYELVDNVDFTYGKSKVLTGDGDTEIFDFQQDLTPPGSGLFNVYVLPGAPFFHLFGQWEGPGGPYGFRSEWWDGAILVGVGHAAGSFSYDITVSGAVPEPGLWALSITGFAAAGASFRWRRRRLPEARRWPPAPAS